MATEVDFMMKDMVTGDVTTTVYKVVKSDMKSVWINEPKLRVQYKIGEVAYPRLQISKLMAFENVAAASRFIFCVSGFSQVNLRILKCEAGEVIRYNNLVLNCTVNYGRVRTFWKRIQENQGFDKNHNRFTKAPPGTVLCGWIKPIEEVERFAPYQENGWE